MGLMRFHVRLPERIADQDLKRVFIVGPDELPFYGRTYLASDVLHVERREDASGALCVPWQLGEGRGPWMLTTTTLMERKRPYQLEVELARGVVYRVRDQLATWQMLGLVAPDELTTLLAQATTAFSRAAVMQEDPPAAVAKAIEAISLGVQATLALAEVYAEQALESRTVGGAKLPTLMGCRITGDPPNSKATSQLSQACNLVAVSCGWKDVEATESKRQWGEVDKRIDWAQKQKLRTCMGPLLEFSDSRTPEWAYLFEGEAETLTGQMLAHVDACVTRYRGKVNLWNVAGQVNRSRSLGLNDEQRLQIVARAVRRIRELDPDTPVTVSFDEPWCESMANDGNELATIEFADALERADLGIAGIGIQFDMGYVPHGSTPRSPLAFSQLLDHWSLRLDLPLLVILTVPGATGPDTHASTQYQLLGGNPTSQFYGLQAQAAWIRQYLPVMLAKNCVQVVLWNQLSDSDPHELPHGGLLDANGLPKPSLEELQKLRTSRLN